MLVTCPVSGRHWELNSDMTVPQYSWTTVASWVLLAITMAATGSERMDPVCDVIPDCDIKAALTIWNYMLLNHTVRKVRLIVSKLSGDDIVQKLCESRGGRPGMSVLTSLTVSVDIKRY